VVARPPLSPIVEPMRLEDLPAVAEIERLSFTTPWPSHAYRTELESNRLAHYRVIRDGDRVVAYAGVWLLVDLAIERGAREATLEVRLSNLPARRLYEKFGFRPVGVRPHYYTDDREDALIMTTEPLADPAMRDRIAVRRAAIARLDDAEADRVDEAVRPDAAERGG